MFYIDKLFINKMKIKGLNIAFNIYLSYIILILMQCSLN